MIRNSLCLILMISLVAHALADEVQKSPMQQATEAIVSEQMADHQLWHAQAIALDLQNKILTKQLADANAKGDDLQKMVKATADKDTDLQRQLQDTRTALSAEQEKNARAKALPPADSGKSPPT